MAEKNQPRRTWWRQSLRKTKLDYLNAAYESLIRPLKALRQATKSRLIEELDAVLDGGGNKSILRMTPTQTQAEAYLHAAILPFCALFMDELLSFSGILPQFERVVLQQMLSTAQHSTRLHSAMALVEPKHRLLVALKLLSKQCVEICFVLFCHIFQSFGSERLKIQTKEYVLLQVHGTCQVPRHLSTSSVVYGEIDFNSFIAILERLSIKSGDVFVDLGHGTGKAVVCASLLFGHLFSRVHGIELLQNLFDVSVETVDMYRKLVDIGASALLGEIIECDSPQLFRETHRSCSVTVSCHDFLEDPLNSEDFRWTSADVVFANSTCFDDDLMDSLSSMANSMKIGSRFVSLTRPLQSDCFTIEFQCQYPMSWGTATCYFQNKLF